MHNRARMVVASFLTKDLMIDWRTGAEFFMQHLVDGDIAQNQLNWQWVAGTGTDTNPLRVYNPTVQSRKFDPDGVYIRRYVAELADCPGDVHDPSPADRARAGYPEPIVDHAEAIAAWPRHAPADSETAQGAPAPKVGTDENEHPDDARDEECVADRLVGRRSRSVSWRGCARRSAR